jgi:hypothetical protein
MLVAGPRNHLYRHEKVASFWRPFRLLGDGQHRGQIASQLDPELALLRSQHDRINQSTERFRRLQAAVLVLECRGQVLDLPAVEVGHARMEQRRRLSRCIQLLFELIPSSADRDQLVLDVSPAHIAWNPLRSSVAPETA